MPGHVNHEPKVSEATSSHGDLCSLWIIEAGPRGKIKTLHLFFTLLRPARNQRLREVKRLA